MRCSRKSQYFLIGGECQSYSYSETSWKSQSFMTLQVKLNLSCKTETQKRTLFRHTEAALSRVRKIVK
ncbi:unnamed protein product [Pleuronectes platessa]|uniref:Uncharacterized protein n=1 Tax=Pleuronectes platessa TaxID=8262 RepID=A0A9N7UDR3_PLEPL|nr:unnamed protein product [Pleuronectes platessa]